MSPSPGIVERPGFGDDKGLGLTGPNVPAERTNDHQRTEIEPDVGADQLDEFFHELRHTVLEIEDGYQSGQLAARLDEAGSVIPVLVEQIDLDARRMSLRLTDSFRVPGDEDPGNTPPEPEPKTG